MKVTKTTTAIAIQFVKENFKTIEVGNHPKHQKEQHFFDSIEVRTNGQEFFIMLPTSKGDVRVMEEEWIVTDEAGNVEIMNDADFKATYTEVKEVKEAKSKEAKKEEVKKEAAPAVPPAK